MFTSIRDLVTANDLNSRTVKLDLQRIEYKSERVLDEAFDKARSRILGAVYKALSCGLRNYQGGIEVKLPRMADLASWIIACEADGLLVSKDDGTAFGNGCLFKAFEESIAAAKSEALESYFARLIIGLMEAKPEKWNEKKPDESEAKMGRWKVGEWKGTGAQLAVAFDLRDSSGAPLSDPEVKVFVDKVRTLQTPLDSLGIQVSFHRTHGKKLIRIEKKSAIAESA